MYETIESHPTVREQYAAALVEAGVVIAEEADGLVEEVQAQDARRRTSSSGDARGGGGVPPKERRLGRAGSEQPDTRRARRAARAR